MLERKESKMRKEYQIYENSRMGCYIRTICERPNRRQSSAQYTHDEAIRKIRSYRGTGIDFLVYELIDVTEEMKKEAEQ